MAILADHQIKVLCQTHKMIDPFEEQYLNPASIDVRLGDRILVEVECSTNFQLVDLKQSGFTKWNPYLWLPQVFILSETFEVFNIPRHIAGQFALKSSRAREGFEHLLAGYIDPGFSNSRLTLELVNSRRLHPIPIWPGMRIGQIVFHRMDQQPEKDYSVVGNYNDCLTVTQSRGNA